METQVRSDLAATHDDQDDSEEHDRACYRGDRQLLGEGETRHRPTARYDIGGDCTRTHVSKAATASSTMPAVRIRARRLIAATLFVARPRCLNGAAACRASQALGVSRSVGQNEHDHGVVVGVAGSFDAVQDRGVDRGVLREACVEPCGRDRDRGAPERPRAADPIPNNDPVDRRPGWAR